MLRLPGIRMNKIRLVRACFVHILQLFQVPLNLLTLFFVLNYLTNTLLNVLLVLRLYNLFDLLEHLLALNPRIRLAFLVQVVCNNGFCTFLRRLFLDRALLRLLIRGRDPI